MFTHAQIWQGIDRLASSKGYSPSGLAKLAGLDPTSFNKSKRHSPDGKPRWPSTESLSKVLSVTGATMGDFVELIGANDDDESFSKQEIAARTAEILIETESVLFNTKTPFAYVSGKKGPVYVDARRLISFVEERETLINFAASLLCAEAGANAVNYIAGGETAGIPYAAFIAQRLRKPMLYVRKKPKGHGRLSQIEGVFEQDKSPAVILIEDVQNFGHSKKIFVDVLREAGARIEHVFVLFDHGIHPEVAQVNKEMGVTVHSLCTWRDVLKTAKEKQYFDPETLDSVETYLNNPAKWQEQHT